MKNKEIIEFLDKYCLKGDYSGGNDSGGIESLSTEIPVPPGEKDLIDDLKEFIYEEVFRDEYGSWAWNFSANGEISYNKEEKKIEVDGYHTEHDDLETIETIKIDLKKYFSEEDQKRIDSINISLIDYEDLLVRINILGGAWTDSLQKSEEALVKELQDIKDANDLEGYKFYLDENFILNNIVTIEIQQEDEQVKHWEIDLLEEDDFSETEIEKEVNHE